MTDLTKTDVPKIRMGSRSDQTFEVFTKAVLGGGALVLVALYLTSLVYLVVRGGSKAISFTQFANPLSNIDGEVVYRIIFSALFGFGVGYTISLIPCALLRRGESGKYEKIARLAPRVVGVLGAVVFALVLRDHLPRFLVALPSETQPNGGIGPEIFNTVYLAVLSTLVTTPIGVGAAVYLARFARSPAMKTMARVALDTLASLPSIVYGLFGFLVFVVMLHAGYSLLAGAAVLSLLNLPLVVAISEEAIRHVPRDLEDASLALGATPTQTVLRVTLPYAWPGILSAVVLSLGRVFAERAPLLMTAGTTISRSTAFSADPTRGGETLAVHLWYVNSAGLAPDKEAVSASTAAVLVGLVVLMNVLATRLARYGGAAGSRSRRAAR